MKKIDVSIIIVNYNTKKYIIDCIKSIYKNTKNITYEIIVCDNNSTDDSIAVIRTLFPLVKIIQMKENIGFGKANNEGILVSEGRNIFFLNPDTVLLNNAVCFLSDFIDKNSSAGSAGANLFTEDLLPNISYHMKYPFIIDEIDQFSKRLISKIFFGRNYVFNHTNRIKKVAFNVGAALMIRKELLDTVGYFDKIFFMYYEETELSYRLNKKGFINYNIPYAKILHYEGKSFNHSNKRESMCMISRKQFLIKCRSFNYYIFSTLFYLFFNYLYLFIAIISNNSSLYEIVKQRIKILIDIK